MQTVNFPTSYAIIRAATSSQWDKCSFAIISLSDQWKERLRQRHRQLVPLKGDPTFYSLTYWDKSVRFFRDPLSGDEKALKVDEILEETEIWAFVTLEESEMEQFAPPIDTLRAAQLVIIHDGFAKFISWGERSSSQYMTQSFFVEDMLG